jgi:hypothetical protein
MQDNIIPLWIPSGSERVAAQLEGAVRNVLGTKAYTRAYLDFVMAEVRPVIERAHATMKIGAPLPDSLAGLTPEQILDVGKVAGASQVPLLSLFLSEAVLRASVLWQVREFGLEIQPL